MLIFSLPGELLLCSGHAEKDSQESCDGDIYAPATSPALRMPDQLNGDKTEYARFAEGQWLTIRRMQGIKGLCSSQAPL